MALSHELLGRWTHAYEESSTDMVFRPADSPLPPSRGRMAFEFRDDGTFIEGSPGPTDRSQRAAGQWSLDGNSLRLVYSDRPTEVFKVTTAKDKLVLSKT
jgi:hypothetical protein